MQTVYKSALRKAVSRSDARLARVAFDLLWKDELSRHWLQWQLPVIALENAWYLLPVVANLLDLKEAKKADWWKGYQLLLASPKSKDVQALSLLGQLSKEATRRVDPSTGVHPDIRWARNVNHLCAEFGPEKAAVSIAQDLQDIRSEFTSWETKALNLAASRAQQGGLESDRRLFVSSLPVIVLRGLDPDKTKEFIKASFKPAKKKAPTDVSIPWWVYDSWTDIGNKSALEFLETKMAKKVDLTLGSLSWLFFFLESNRIPVNKFHVGDFENPEPWENRWWLPLMQASLARGGSSTKEVSRLWGRQWAPELEKTIQRLLKK